MGNKADMIRPFIEKTFKDILGVEELIIDSDGDIPIRWGSTMIYVRVIANSDPVIVRLFSPMVRNIKKTAKLLEYLNEANASSSGLTLQWVDDDVVINTDLYGETVDRDELNYWCTNIGNVADRHDTVIKEQFGGDLFYEDEAAKDTKDEPVDV